MVVLVFLLGEWLVVGVGNGNVVGEEDGGLLLEIYFLVKVKCVIYLFMLGVFL